MKCPHSILRNVPCCLRMPRLSSPRRFFPSSRPGQVIAVPVTRAAAGTTTVPRPPGTSTPITKTLKRDRSGLSASRPTGGRTRTTTSPRLLGYARGAERKMLRLSCRSLGAWRRGEDEWPRVWLPHCGQMGPADSRCLSPRVLKSHATFTVYKEVQDDSSCSTAGSSNRDVACACTRM